MHCGNGVDRPSMSLSVCTIKLKVTVHGVICVGVCVCVYVHMHAYKSLCTYIAPLHTENRITIVFGESEKRKYCKVLRQFVVARMRIAKKTDILWIQKPVKGNVHGAIKRCIKWAKVSHETNVSLYSRWRWQSVARTHTHRRLSNIGRLAAELRMSLLRHTNYYAAGVTYIVLQPADRYIIVYELGIVEGG